VAHNAELAVATGSGASVTALVYEAKTTEPGPTLVLAHGAGAGQRSPFMTRFAAALAGLGVRVVTFNFLYTEQGRKLPDRPAVLEACYRAVIETVCQELSGNQPLITGGKSMGGRIATQVAAADDDLPIDGIVLLGYPLHPPGRPAERRDAHLPRVRRPMLFVQGGRDAFGTPDELRPVLDQLQPRADLYVVAGGDHSFKVSRASREALATIERDVQHTMRDWIGRVTRRPTGRPRPLR
jgi:predicted alpha/beta-hydrolase family hydrolase